MRYIIMVLLLAVLAALQSSVAPYIRLYSGQPNIIFLLVVAWSLDTEWSEAMLWAFLGGVFQDLLSIAPLGTSILPLCTTVFTVKMIQQQLEGLSLLLYMAVVTVGSFFALIFLFICLGLVGYAIDLIPTIRYFMLPTLGYQLLLALPTYVLVRWLNQKTAVRRAFGVSP